jgi:hypothetical protein
VSPSGPFFCLETESDAKHVVTVIRSLQEYLKTDGLDPVFNIVTATETIDMLERPSLLTKPLIETWLKDLKTDGVHNGQGG